MSLGHHFSCFIQFLIEIVRGNIEYTVVFHIFHQFFIDGPIFQENNVLEAHCYCYCKRLRWSALAESIWKIPSLSKRAHFLTIQDLKRTSMFGRAHLLISLLLLFQTAGSRPPLPLPGTSSLSFNFVSLPAPLSSTTPSKSLLFSLFFASLLTLTCSESHPPPSSPPSLHYQHTQFFYTE